MSVVMNAYPIIFSEPMIIALNRRLKTQTRRIPNPLLNKVKKGDMLWVREAAVYHGGLDKTVQGYQASGYNKTYSFETSRRSIHMPRWASRITLEVAEAKKERLQDITEDDAWAEGVAQCLEILEQQEGAYQSFEGDDLKGFVRSNFGSCRAAFRWLWDKLNDERGRGWNDNPEVCVFKFRVHYANIDKLLKTWAV